MNNKGNMTMINLEDLTIKQVNQLKQMFGGSGVQTECESMFEVGKCYFIRSVTHHYTGRATKVTSEWIELSDAAWIADDGRFNEFLRTGEAKEVEPYVEPVRIPIGSVLDQTEWKHALPRSVK
jgi:hypothetical protein